LAERPSCKQPAKPVLSWAAILEGGGFRHLFGALVPGDACTPSGGGRGRGPPPIAALLPIRERVLGAEHPDTLRVRNNLAGWTGEAGDAAGARDQFAALLPIYERVLGAEHPDTLTVRRNLVRWTRRSE
jgi:Tetratricopeptide repeat